MSALGHLVGLLVRATAINGRQKTLINRAEERQQANLFVLTALEVVVH